MGSVKEVPRDLADKRGRTGHEDDSDEQMELLRSYHRAAMQVDGGAVARTLKQNGTEADGMKIKKEIRRQRIAAITEVQKGIVLP